jgi:flavodoxin
MKTLIVFYSRTGTTQKLAQALAEELGNNAVLEEIKDTANRAGVRGYLLSGRDATLRKLTKLEPFQNDPNDFDLVAVGTPIWSWNLSTPIRTYLENNKDRFKKTAFFAVMGGSGTERAAKEMEKITGIKNQAILGVKTTEIIKGDLTKELTNFSESLLN